MSTAEAIKEQTRPLCSTGAAPQAATVSPALNQQIIEFGRRIFTAIGEEQPSGFNTKNFSGKIMEWSMTQPEFKVNMFRLVDVLPTLRSSAAIAAHVNEYLGKIGASMNGLMEWGLNLNPHSLRAKATAMVVRASVGHMASQFIAGESPKEALKELRRLRKQGMTSTVDLLGEFSLSEPEADAYVNRYLEALEVLGKEMPTWKESASLMTGHAGETTPICISVKLSALYSQTSPMNFDRSVAVLTEKFSKIVRKAKEVNALVYVDAEDSGSNPIIYETFKRVFMSPEFIDFPYPGIVIQAYARRSKDIVLDMIAYARKRGRPIAVRLVKGAYWDLETIGSQQNNWPSPLWSKKESSDANYEALSRILIDNHDCVLPAFGSHNVRSLSHACMYAEQKGLAKKDIELQMLYGMAEPIAMAYTKQGYLTRLYVPLGEMLPGMGYLVRRLLENTSNESFLRHTFFDSSTVDELLREPILRE